jgi:large subunit ribosomal protein L21
MDYAVIRVGNKQHRVRDGETLVVDRLHTDAGGTFEPDVLLGEDGVKVTVKVLAHERGPKIRIGKYRKRTGYKRHNGFRAATSRIEVTIGDGKRRAAKGRKAEETPKPETPVEEIPVEETLEVETAPEAEELPVEETSEPEAATETEAKPEAEAAPAGLPEGYDGLTVADISKAAKSWEGPQLEAALAYEQEHAARKGAISALKSALASQERDQEEDA